VQPVNAAAPGQVGLHDVTAAPLQQLAKAPARVLVLACGDGHALDAARQLDMAVVVVGREALLDPAHTARAHQLGHAQRVLHVPAM